VPSPPDPHGWNSWTAYLAAHDGKLGDYSDHFLIDNRLEHTLTDIVVRWTGELVCVDGYEVHIRRSQVVDFRQGTPWVRTSIYSYQALHRGPDATRRLFRYDNIHPHHGHQTPHHRHRFDINGLEIHPAEHVGLNGWPNLGQVLDELHAYWSQRR
jgi:hypothetical protein